MSKHNKAEIKSLVVKQKAIRNELARGAKAKKMTELSKKKEVVKPIIEQLKDELTARPLPLHVLVEDADFLNEVVKKHDDHFDVFFDVCRLEMLVEVMKTQYNHIWMQKSYRKELEEIYQESPKELERVYKYDKKLYDEMVERINSEEF